MDDLLALFGSENIDDRLIHQQPQNSNTNTDDENDTPSQYARQRQQKQQKQEGKQRKSYDEKLLQVVQHPNRKATSSSIYKDDDDRFGIRMINRKISSSDLMNRMMDHPYHSAAQLSAYRLSSLNALLVEPTMIIDVATVNGNMSLWTMGIIFTSTGSRIGPSGKAFCMITIGNLATGPTIRIMLFGTSYLSYCRTLRPGKVIAIIDPRLLPPRAATTGGSSSSNDRTTLTFSIMDKEQLLFVGDAQDYGICKGTATASTKNEYGQWIPNRKPCSNYIDVRQGDFCTHHRKQHSKQSNSGSSTGTTRAVSSIQQLRNQATAFPTTTNNKNTLLRSDQTNRTATSNITNKHKNTLCQPIHTAIVKNNIQPQSKPFFQQLSSIPMVDQTQQPQNRYTQHQAKNPLLSDASSSRSSTGTRQPLINTSSVNPYEILKSKMQPMLPPTTHTSVPTVHVTRNALTAIDVLQPPPTKRQTISTNFVINTAMSKRRRSVNTDFSGFNGSVAIPVPAKTLFSQTNGGTTNASVLFTHQANKLKHDQSQRINDHVIAKQQLLASQLQECRTSKSLNDHSNTIRPPANVISNKVKKSENENAKDNPFGELFDSNERENIINAKSQFTSEVEAEDYARSRRVVCELEEHEYKAQKKDSNSNSSSRNPDDGLPVIQKEWYCRDCKKQFAHEPIRCKRLQHRVKFERSIRTAKTKGEERLAISEAKTEDGGLVLGTGLDWSRFNR